MENNWVLQDGRSILVEFAPTPPEADWGWFGMRSSGEGMQFAAVPAEWANPAWNRSSDYIMAADSYVPPSGVILIRTLLGIGV